MKNADESAMSTRPRYATACPWASHGGEAMRPSLIKPEMMRPIVVL